MKTRFYFLILAALASVASGCSEGEACMEEQVPRCENTTDAQEEVADQPDSPAEREIVTRDLALSNRHRGDLAVSFRVETDWSASISYEDGAAGWLAIAPESGPAGPSALGLTVADNTDPQPRRAFIDIIHGDSVLRLVAMQFGAEPEMKSELEMHTDTSEFGKFFAHESYEETISFRVNADWELEVEYKTGQRDWLTVTPRSGTAGEVELTMTLPENPSDDRSAVIRIIYGEESLFDYRWRPEHTIGVRQYAINLAHIFEPELTRLLHKKGYIADERHISPDEVKQIKMLNLMGAWSYPEQRYLGELTSLRGIEYFESLEYLSCWGNHLTSLDVSRNKALKELWCYNNDLVSIDVSGCPELEVLYCHSNPISSLNVSGNPALTSLNCDNLLLTSLDVSSNPALVLLSMDENRVETLDVTHNPELWVLDCSDNCLRGIDVSCNPDLRQFKCDRNPGDGKVFPIRSWFDLASMPTGSYVHFTTEEWSYENRTIVPEYRMVE